MSRPTICALALAAVFTLSSGCTAQGGSGNEALGQSCVTSGNCGGSPCVPVGGTERVCTLDCVSDVDCMAGWACEAFGGVGDVCRCDAEPELCNAADDDCDGVIDEECGDALCGDESCSSDEDCSSCPEDCGACVAGCGDRVCSEGESCETCAPDCGACEVECGDGTCNTSEETCESCGVDCGPCPAVCGDGTCDAPEETCGSCAEDCGPCCDDGDEEPNDIETMSVRQGRPAPWGCVYEDSFGGTLSGSADEDWFSVPSSDTRYGGCTHSVTVSTPGVSLCIFGSCAVLGSTPTTSCVSGAPTTSAGGKPGCCTTAGPAAMRIECSPGSSTATSFLVQVSGAPAAECVPYDVTFSGTTP